MRDAGECLMKSTDPSRIEPAQVGELPLAVDGAEEASVPAPQIPTDGANEEGVTSTIPMVRDPGFRKGEDAGGLLGLTGLESSIYPGSGPFVEGKTPTTACLVLISARLLLQGVASQIGSGAGAAVYLLVYDCLSL